MLLNYTKDDIDENSVFAVYDPATGEYVRVILGGIDKLQNEFPSIGAIELSMLLYYGSCGANSLFFRTFSWRIGDMFEDQQSDIFLIDHVSIHPLDRSHICIDYCYTNTVYPSVATLEDFESDIADGKIKQILGKNRQSSPASNEKHKCICDSYDLFHFGCKCGGK